MFGSWSRISPAGPREASLKGLPGAYPLFSVTV